MGPTRKHDPMCSPTAVLAGWLPSVAVCVALLGASACGSSTRGSSVAGRAGEPGVTGGGASGGAGSGGQTGGAGAGGQLAGASGGGSPPLGLGGQAKSAYDDVLACDVMEPCETVSVGGGECPTFTGGSAENLVCVLESLRDRVPGRYRVSSNVCSAIGTMSTREVIVVHDDGRVTIASCAFTSLSACGEPKECDLASPAYFDNCLAMSAEFRPGYQTPCASLASALTDCVPAPVRCE